VVISVTELNEADAEVCELSAAQDENIDAKSAAAAIKTKRFATLTPPLL